MAEEEETVVTERHDEAPSSSTELDPVVELTSSVSSTDKLTIDENEEIRLLCEIVGGYKLARDDRCDNLDESVKPYCVVKFGHNIIHRTKKASEGGPNPIWTVSTGAFFLLVGTPRLFVQNDLHLSIWFKQKDPLELTVLEKCFLGKADVDLSKVVRAQCNEERLEVDLKDGNVDTGLKWRGTLTLRFRLATSSDERFLSLLQKRPELLKQKSTRNITAAEKEESTTDKESSTSLLITEANESQLAGESFVNALSSAFTSKKYHDNKSGQEKVLVKPNPDPDRVDETTYLSKQEIVSETLAPSKQWVQAGSGKLGKLYLEILSCHDLPNADLGEAVGNFSDVFVSAVFEDVMVQTPVIDDELSPHWLPWTQRAFVFNMMHPASMLYLGTFDYDLGISNHEALGRVVVNISNLQRDTEYTLTYNLYPSTSVTDRTAVGSITIRLRLEYNNEKEALLEALKPRPKFHINVRREKSLSVLRYTCFGEYGDDNEQSFDLTVTRSYINEILEYKRALSYCFSDALRSLVFWRGQVTVCNMRLPLHSFLFFCFATTLVERPYLAPSFFLLSVAWIMLAAQTQRRQHPSPWHQCHSFWHFVEILHKGKSSKVRGIKAFEGAEKAEVYEKEWHERLKKDERMAEKQAAMQQEIQNIGDEAIHTKMAGGIPLDILVRLTRYQGIIGRVCAKFRFVKIIVTWEESVISFWITACFLTAGLLSLLLPWSFILLRMSRIVVHCLFGPHMKLVDWWLQENGKDDTTLEKAIENFKKESRSARIRREEAVKLRDLKELAFGKFITRVPSHNLSRYYDRPLAGSSARLHSNCEIKMAPYGVPGQQLFGVILPRTEPEALQYEKEAHSLQQVQAALSSLVKSIEESENCKLIKRLKCQDFEEADLPEEVGYELISFDRSGTEGPSGEQEACVQVSEATSLSLAPKSKLAIIHKGKGASSSRRRSSAFQGGYELIAVDENIGKEHGCVLKPGFIQMGNSDSVELDAGKKLAIIKNEDDHTSTDPRSSIKHTQSWSAGDNLPCISPKRSRLAVLHETDEERESGEVEVVLGAPKRDDVSGTDDSVCRQIFEVNECTQVRQTRFSEVDGFPAAGRDDCKDEAELDDDASTVYYQHTTSSKTECEQRKREEYECDKPVTAEIEDAFMCGPISSKNTGNKFASIDEGSVIEFQPQFVSVEACEQRECDNEENRMVGNSETATK